MVNDTIDHNPNDPTTISRKFEDPFKRLEDINERIHNGKYFDVTIGSGVTDKYLWELYYDLIFINLLLIELGVCPKVSKPVPAHVAGKVDLIVNDIIKRVKNGQLSERKEDEQQRGFASS